MDICNSRGAGNVRLFTTQNAKKSLHALYCYIVKGRATFVSKREGKMYLNPEADWPQTVPGIETL